MNKKLKLTTVDGFTISAIHTIAKCKGVVLWLHGITVDKNEYLDFFKDGAELLSASGIDSLRIDFRGHGSSTGSSKDFSIVGQMLDVEAALRYLTQFYKGLIKVAIVGCSFGAPPAIFSAEQYPNGIADIVLIAPVLSYKRTFLVPETEWGKSLFNARTLAKLNRSDLLNINDNFQITNRLVEEMRIIKPDVSLKGLKQGVTIIHGDADSMVPFQASKDIANACPLINFIPMPRMDHGFTDVDDESGKDSRSFQNKMDIYKIIQDQIL